MLGKNAERPLSPSFITLGPEWMSSGKVGASIDDQNRFAPPTLASGLISIRNKSVQSDANSQRRRAPNLEKLGKSKSSPLLLDHSAEQEQSKDIYTLVKEKNTFDKNFPTLSRKSKLGGTISPKGTLRSPSPSTTKENSWKQISERAASGQKTPPGSTTPPSSASNSSENISGIKLLSPPVESKFIQLSPPSINNTPTRKEKESPEPTKKTETSTSPVATLRPSAKRFEVLSFRKASSEPNFPITPQDRESYKMTFNSNKHFVGEVKSQNRKDFFLSLMKKKENESEESEKGDWFGNYSSMESIVKQDSEAEPARGSPETERPSSVLESWESYSDVEMDQQSLKSFDDQEEMERFLRNMGWVPEEEDHIPELTEEEINGASIHAI